MKHIIILLLVSGNLFAQDIYSPLRETEIYTFIGGINPDLTPSQEMAQLTADVLGEWVLALSSSDNTQIFRTFLYKDDEYVIVSNAWPTYSAKGRSVTEMMFDNTDPLIIRNNGKLNLVRCIKKAKKAGVSFVHVINADDSSQDIDIFLILLK